MTKRRPRRRAKNLFRTSTRASRHPGFERYEHLTGYGFRRTGGGSSSEAPARKRTTRESASLLDQIARSQAGKSYKSLTAAEKKVVDDVAARMQNPRAGLRQTARGASKAALHWYDKGVSTAYNWTAGLPSRLGHSLVDNPSPDELASSYEEHLGLTTSPEFIEASPEEQAAMMTGMDMSEYQEHEHGPGCGCPHHNPRPEMTKDLAWSAAMDAANRNMRKHGRTAWNEEDRDVAVETFHRLWKDPLEEEWKRQHGENPSRPVMLTVGKQMSLMPPHPSTGGSANLQPPFKFIPKYTPVRIEERGRGGHRFLVHGEYYSQPFWGWVDKEDLQPYDPDDAHLLRNNPAGIRQVSMGSQEYQDIIRRTGPNRKTLAVIRKEHRRLGGEIVQIVDSQGRHITYTLVRSSDFSRPNPSIFDYEEAYKAGRERGSQMPGHVSDETIDSAFGTWWIYSDAMHRAIPSDRSGNLKAFKRGFRETSPQDPRRRNPEGWASSFNDLMAMIGGRVDDASAIARIRITSRPRYPKVGSTSPWFYLRSDAEVKEFLSALQDQANEVHANFDYRIERKWAGGWEDPTPDEKGKIKTRKTNGRGRRRNPESGAAEMFESFHGYAPERDSIIEEEEHYHEHLATLGDLRALEVITPTNLKVEFGFEGEGGMPILASNEDGTQLFIEGGDQSIDLKSIKMDGKKWRKEKMVIGDIDTITYDTEKTFDNREPVSYYHHFTEDEPGQPLPQLVYDTVNQKLSIVGGKYFIKKPLIGVSPGIEN